MKRFFPMKMPIAILLAISLLFGATQVHAAGRLVYPIFKAFDSNSNLLVGGKLYTYEPGTTTPKATYSNSGETVAHTNPIILDTLGEKEIFLPGATKLVLKDSSDVAIWTKDNVYPNENFIAGDTASVENIAALRLVTGEAGSSARPRGYYSEADGGGGPVRVWDAASTATDNGGSVIRPTAIGAGSPGRWVWEYSGPINVKWFGAVSDGADTGAAFTGTDNTASFQAALDYTGANSLQLEIPAGKYRFAAVAGDNTQYILLNNSTHIITGEGAELLIDDDSPITHTTLDFIRTPNNGSSTALNDRGLLKITGITFRGRWSHSNTYAGPNVLTVENFSRVILEGVSAYDIRAKFSRSAFIGELTINNFHGERIASDCLRFVDTENVNISNVTLFEIDDDSIALPVNSTAVADGRQQINISNVNIGKSEGILILGARNTNIADITLRMCHGTQLYIGGVVGSEGNSAPYNISLSNINIIDPLNRADGGSNGIPPTTLLTSLEGAIILSGIEPSSVTSGARPEFYDSVAGAFVIPYSLDTSNNPIFYNYDRTTKTINPGMNFSLTGFNITRTLPSVTNYSDWGFGQAFSRWGRFDPPVADANFSTNGVVLLGSLKNVVVSTGNVFGFPSGSGVFLRSTAALAANRDREFENILISNVNTRHTQHGVSHSLFAAASAVSWDVTVANSTFDCDPYHVSPARTTPIDGSWNSASTVAQRSFGVYFTKGKGWKISNCTFSNCYQPVLSSATPEIDSDMSNNIVRCQPSALGYSASNKGVGVVSASSPAFRYIIVDSTPNSATYGTVLNHCVTHAASVPVSGTYVTGHFVRNTSPTTASSKTTFGWFRQTVGSGHTVATTTTADWAPLVIPTN